MLRKGDKSKQTCLAEHKATHVFNTRPLPPPPRYPQPMIGGGVTV